MLAHEIQLPPNGSRLINKQGLTAIVKDHKIVTHTGRVMPLNEYTLSFWQVVRPVKITLK